GVAERIRVDQRIPYEEIPHFSPATVESHKGDLIFGTMAGCDVVAMQGRIHYYEGYTLQQTTLPVRVMRALGARVLFVNSAAGGLNPGFEAGDLMIVTDHINLIGENPLRGLTDPRLGDRFPDMSKPYDMELVCLAEEAAADLKIAVRQGVYVGVSGPSLETRAETRMLRMLGADAVGMSTVPEVIVARQVGFRTLALAVVTNVNIPDAMEPVLTENVIANARRAEPRLAALVEETIWRVAMTFAAEEQ
ncbi:MAG: purine-nucleoside phosphorylase, partial [Deltaproteobacteria bacterium]|nr:purine-nucleoside phosphorylase [Deltaproteobacteria bacterium]